MFGKEMDRKLFILGLVLMGVLLYFVSQARAGIETVKDNNDGNIGDILVNSGTKNGNSDVGHWVDPIDIPELKGDKGDTGLQGIQGIAGLNGKDGKDGQDGINGLNGINGVNGIDGVDGIDGINGLNGIDGQDGKDGLGGLNGIDGINGIDGAKGDKGDTGNDGIGGLNGKDGGNGVDGINGTNGKDIDPATVVKLDNQDVTLQNNINTESTERKNQSSILNQRMNDMNNRIDNIDSRLSKLEQTQYVAEIAFRILDTRRLTISPFFRANFTRGKIDTVGIKVTIKFGTSYEEREIIKTNKRLDRLEAYISTPEVQEAIEQVRMNKLEVITDGKSFRIKKEF